MANLGEGVNSNTQQSANTTPDAVKEPSAKVFDDVCIVAASETAQGVTAPVVLEKPLDGSSYVLAVEPGKKYFFDFQESDVQSLTEKDGDLTVVFKDGSTITLTGFSVAMQGDLPAIFAFSDQLSSDEFLKMIQVVDTTPDQKKPEEAKAEIRETKAEQVEVAKVEPAAGEENIAEQLAGIEPAAGDAGGGAAGRGGYGYQSSFDAQGVNPLNDVGPIGPTELQYNVNFSSDILLLQEEDDVPNINDDTGIGTGSDVVDETNILPETVNGTIGIDFGNDGPGAFGADGNFTSSYALFSGGNAVAVTQTATGYVGTANGITVFEITIDGDGNYSFTQFAPLDHADAANPDDAVTLSFGVAISDSDGDTDAGVIQIEVRDDGPLAVDDGNFINTKSAISGNVLTNDDFGADGAGVVQSVTFNGTTAAIAPGATVTIDGVFGQLTISSNGAYSYTAKGGIDGTDQFTYVMQDFDGDTDTATLTIEVQVDQQPILVQPEIVTIDETNLSPTIFVSDTIQANFGIDGPGSFAGNGGFFSSLALTSGGNSIVVGFNAATNTYTGTASGNPVFTLVVQANGNYAFTLLDTIDHPNAANPNDSIVLEFGVTATDVDGDFVNGVITVNVLDDGPSAVNDGKLVDTLTPISGNVLANDSFGKDGPGAVKSVTFNGVTTNIAAGATVNIDGAFGKLTISSNGAYTYTPKGGIDGTDQFTYVMQDFDGDTATAQLAIGVSVDDRPVIVQPETATVDETNLSPTTSVSGTVDVNFGVDTPGAVAGNGNFAGGSFTSGGAPVSVSFNAANNTYTGTAGGNPVFTLVVQANGNYAFTLLDTIDHPNAANPNDSVTLQFGVTATDADGDTATGTITINVLDDGPVAVNDGAFANSVTPISGNVLTNDDFGKDGAGAVKSVSFGGATVNIASGATVNVIGAFGTLQVSSNGAYTYTPKGGIDGTDQFTYVMQDFDGDTATAKLTVQVNIDNVPVIVPPGAVVVDETNLNPSTSVSSSVQVNFGTDAPGTIKANNVYSASMTLKSGGVDIVVTQVGNDYVGKAGTQTVFTLTLNQNTGAYTFTLLDTIDHPNAANPNDSITLQFGVTATDADGDTATGTITINVFDDGPVAVNDTRSVDNLTPITGNVVSNDNFGKDGPGTVKSVTFNGVATNIASGATVNIDGNFGKLTISSTGAYTYKAKPGADGTDSFRYTMHDFDNDPASADLIINVKPCTLIVDETNLNPTTSISSTVQASFGPDGSRPVIANNIFTAAGSVAGGVLKSGGVNVVVTQDGNGYIGKAGSQTVFTLTLNQNTGAYTFTLVDTLDHADVNNHDDVITLNFGVKSDEDVGVSATSITVCVKDDGPVANDDNVTAEEGIIFSGNVMANDNPGKDTPASISQVVFGGVTHIIPAGGSVVINANFGKLTMNSNGSYTYQTTSEGTDNFTYTLKDFDGDTDTGVLSIRAIDSDLIVGTNVDDNDGSITPYLVGDGFGSIKGKSGNDILIGDAGGSFLQPQIKDYNVVLMLDTSDSMDGSKIRLLRDSVNNLLKSFNEYNSGVIKVHIITFEDRVEKQGTFVVTNDAEFTNAQAFVSGLNSDGATNYEDPLQKAIFWLKGAGNKIPGADTYSYFVSDGEPNRYVLGGNTEMNGSADKVMAEILGLPDNAKPVGGDGTNEVGILRGLSKEVISVGIGVNSTTLGRLNIIDSDGKALDVKNPEDLDSTFQEQSPLNRLTSTGNDRIIGNDGDDLIYGDAVYTDALADVHGFTTFNGVSWEVFERLEAGQSAIDPTWNRQDTLDYIRSHVIELGRETLDINGNRRDGGNDVLRGGAGNDIIFGQEGKDILIGDAGNDTLYGGSGKDIFMFTAINEGVDTIKDFKAIDDFLDISDLLIGYDSVQDSINDFVFKTESGGNTMISVDADGKDGPATAVNIALLEGVTGLNIEQITNDGKIVIV